MQSHSSHRVTNRLIWTSNLKKIETPPLGIRRIKNISLMTFYTQKPLKNYISSVKMSFDLFLVVDHKNGISSIYM